VTKLQYLVRLLPNKYHEHWMVRQGNIDSSVQMPHMRHKINGCGALRTTQELEDLQLDVHGKACWKHILKQTEKAVIPSHQFLVMQVPC
jgi:hypothetical protein